MITKLQGPLKVGFIEIDGKRIARVKAAGPNYRNYLVTRLPNQEKHKFCRTWREVEVYAKTLTP